MTRPRLAHALIASTAAAALAVGGVLIGTAPVSAAAPAQSEECLAALDALEAEFGSIDFDDLVDAEALINEVLEEFFDEAGPLFDELEPLLDRAFELGADEDADTIAEALAGPLDDAETALEDEQTAVDDAQAALTAAQLALQTAVDDGADETALAPLRDAVTAAQTELTEATERRDAAQDLVDEINQLVVDIDAIFLEIDAIFETYAPRLDELEGLETTDIDVIRFVELATAVLTECDLSGGDGGADDDDDDATGGGAAPVAEPATPVKARASFTG